ncbi:MAG: hypothetical protein DRH03_02795 [Deltaproteobacteria bacterium]|nr:MAG: hypothetical protein DRH03_02795 [Deltaproteobacteria bacterium]
MTIGYSHKVELKLGSLKTLVLYCLDSGTELQQELLAQIRLSSVPFECETKFDAFYSRFMTP